MAGLGDEFRAAREARHLSLPDVSAQIHIRTVYLQSIESEDWAGLAAPVYARGFIRTYARFLALDGERAVAEYGKALEVSPAGIPQRRLRRPDRGGRRSVWLWLATAVAACLVGVVAYSAVRLALENRRPPATRPASAAAPAASPAASAPAPLPATESAAPVSSASRPVAAARGQATPAARHRLEVRLTQKSWLEVRVDGASQLIGVFPEGTRRVFHGTRATVRVGNGAGVALTVNGKPLGSMGAAGAVVERRLSL